MSTLLSIVEQILAARRAVPAQRALLVAITGVDGCGKGYVTGRITAALAARQVSTGCIHADGWLNLPAQRFSSVHPAEHFYRHAIRFGPMFSELVLPLRAQRSLRLEADHAEETATTYRKKLYEFADIEVILLEGIYLLKREFQAHYDLSFWIDCSFDAALERAIARAQEGLSPEETKAAYQNIYFPAQRIHFERDRPQTAATSRINNDPGLGPTWEAL